MANQSTIPSNLPSHRRKLCWADAHIKKAEALLAGWNRDGYRFFQQHDDHGFDLFAEMLKPLPEDLPLVVGDTFHCLRDALDHVIFALSLKSGRMLTPNDERAPQFPIYDHAVDIVGDGSIRFLDWHMSAEVCDLAPDPARQPLDQHPLWLLDQMNNRDKHREVAFKPRAQAGISQMAIGNAQIDVLETFGAKSLEVGAPPVMLMKFRGTQLQAKVGQTANVVFDKGVEVADREVISTLSMIHDHIRDAVFQRLEPFL